MNLILEHLLDHNLYASRVWLESCRELKIEQFHQRFDIGCGSVHDTWRHVIGAMLRWSDRIMQREVRPSIEAGGRRFIIDEFLTLLEQADRELREAAENAETKLDQAITVTFTPEMGPLRFTRAATLVHVATHGVHHRAQILNMLRRLGVKDVPDADALDAELSPS